VIDPGLGADGLEPPNDNTEFVDQMSRNRRGRSNVADLGLSLSET
jgi:hypothetical protein